MEERIIELLKKTNKALSVEEIASALNLSVRDIKELNKVLKKMENTLAVARTKKDNYMLFDNHNLAVGVFSANPKGFGFVQVPGSEDIYIERRNLNGALHGDQVVVEYTNREKNEGRVVKVLSRSLDSVVGEFFYEKKKCYVDVDDPRLNIDVKIDNKKTMGAMDGHKVLVKILNQIRKNLYNGEVVRILGHKNDPGVDILSIVAGLGINDTFPDEVEKELESIPYELSEAEIKERLKIGRDLRDKVIFTIDGDDTKDVDDAISIEKLPNGNYKLGVHIADVSHYVKMGSAIEKEAYSRGTSVYLANSVIPMLPHILSNGICSLNEDVDRLAMSCEMEIDPTGKIVDSDIFPSIIRSRKKMTYKNVNKILEDGVIPEGYEPFAKDLLEMGKLAKILRKEKVGRGYIEFDIDEAKIIVDEKGEAIDVVKRYRGAGENLIEDFMIAANETVASTIYFMDLPFVYRIHGEPNEEKIESFKKLLRVLGYKVEKTDKITPKVMQKILDDLKDKKEFYVLSNLLLRSMQKATYDPNNIGHFGLASKCYTHFTSPIRRYPDLTVHRLLKKYLIEHDMSPETITYLESILPELTSHASKQERLAVECERAVDDMKKAEYMMKHIGEEYDGLITGVTSFGMFVGLENLIEGLVKLDRLDGIYTYDEDTFSLISNDKKTRYRLGDNVRVTCVNANKDTRTVDFEIVKVKELKK